MNEFTNTNQMTTHTDLSFITNDETLSLKQRFEVLIRNTSFFDCLVGYFYASGFHSLYKSLDDSEKIRVLIGISTNARTFDMLERANRERQAELQFSHAETKDAVERAVENEMSESADSKEVEEGVDKFVDWIKSGKLELKAYPSRQIHAKLYIMTFREGGPDRGRVITGSSNFTEAGLNDNLEFNVELKNRNDYEFAQNKFNELWADAVDVSEKYVQTIQHKTWLSRKITPYELYLKFLYEYFKDELSQTDELFLQYLPPDFKKLEYQEQAVLNAKKILLEYGGVFISDVVGLGKTYIAAMLAQQLEGRTLVMAPPKLLDRSNPGSWRNVFFDFQVPAHFESLGKLEQILQDGVDKYTNVIVDEAHRYRTETTQSYETLAEICRGKRVILVTATPYNNSPGDILSLLKLFQKSRQSTIPNLPDLETFFKGLQKKADRLDRQKNYGEYLRVMRENAREIRDKVLKYLMVRRTRTEIERYFPEDISFRKLRFPRVEKPQPLFYQLNTKEDEVFNRTVRRLAREFNYARYSPLLYYKGPLGQLEKQSQKNMRRFMKILLVKRLESSFYAFKQSLHRFLRSYELFSRLISKKSLEEDETEAEMSELKYLNQIKEIRDNDSELFEKIKRLPKKARASKTAPSEYPDSVITYFRRGKLQKFFRVDQEARDAEELDFIAAARLLESDPEVEKAKLPGYFHDLLERNKEAFVFATTEEALEPVKRGGQDCAARIVKILRATLKNTQKLTEDQEEYLKNLVPQLMSGGIPKKTAQKAFNSLDKLGNEVMNPLKVLASLQRNIPETFLSGHYAENKITTSDKREIVLSVYLAGYNKESE